jgi:C-terminal processing protease CtpA/Prc
LKPITILANEQSASCGDSFAAFFQDLKRAQIVGSWTAGAGAFTGGGVSLNTPLGISSAIIPIALGYRINGQVLENFGVLPDVWAMPNAKDLRTNYQDFQSKVWKAMGL